MSLYFVGDDPLLIPLIFETYKSSDWFQKFVQNNRITVIVPKIVYPKKWIDMQGKYSSETQDSLKGYLYLDGKKCPLPFQKRRLFQISNANFRDILRDYYLSKIRSSTTNLTEIKLVIQLLY